ncbi:MAG: TonB-dependent receptor plug domain-containing protein [Caulobacteraceae bacterium]
MNAAASAAVCTALLAVATTASAEVGASAISGSSISDLGQLSIEELAKVEIISTTKRGEPLSQAPASVYVITREDIRRSGATSLPEVLRLAPNLQVAQHHGTDYLITARGFSGINTNNKLLVLIDGRTVYSPLHSQVYWDTRRWCSTMSSGSR